MARLGKHGGSGGQVFGGQREEVPLGEDPADLLLERGAVAIAARPGPLDRTVLIANGLQDLLEEGEVPLRGWRSRILNSRSNEGNVLGERIAVPIDDGAAPGGEEDDAPCALLDARQLLRRSPRPSRAAASRGGR